MIRDIYAPTDFQSRNLDPSVPAEQKLEVIRAAQVTARPLIHRGKVFEDDFIVTLPYVDGGLFSHGLTGMSEMLMTDHISVGDAELYGQGIGSRLLKAALRYAVGNDPDVTEFHTGWARLGAINLAVSVLGEENVGVERNKNLYGWGSDKPLEAVFNDFPPEAGKGYQVNSIAARIDRDLAMTFEMPIRIPPVEPSYDDITELL